MKNFLQYKDLKKRLNISYKGIELDRVYSLTAYFTSKDLKIPKSLSIVKKSFAAIDVSDFKLASGSDILSTFNGTRADNIELYKMVTDKLGERITTHYINNWKPKFCFNPKTIFSIFRKVFNSLSNTDISFTNKMVIASELIYFCNTHDELLKLDFSDVKKYLSMFNAVLKENLITQHMKLRGIPTYSLQEGMYFIFKKNIPCDSIQYENITTDHLLCWGQFTIDEYLSYGIDKHRLLLAGYPKEIKPQSMKVNNKFTDCMVLIARDLYRDSNKKLLDLLSNYSMDYNFCLKLHPSCDFEWYKNYADSHNMTIISKDKTVDQSLSKDLYDFTIAVNTTVYYESLIKGIPSIRFSDGMFDIMAGYDDDLFTTEKEFENIILRLKTISIDAYQSKVNKVLEYAIGVGVYNYNSILLK